MTAHGCVVFSRFWRKIRSLRATFGAHVHNKLCRAVITTGCQSWSALFDIKKV